MNRLAVILLFLLCAPLFAQESSSSTQTSAPSVAPDSASSPELDKAEAAIVKSDWKAAEPILDAWIAAHPADSRALFDAGYAADAQNRNDDAVALYRKAIDANPKSFEAQVSLGLLLARLNRPSEARPVLLAATALDAGDAGPAAKARAWRALARIDAKGVEGKPDPVSASNSLLEALKLSPETADDTLLAAELADANGDAAGAEAAYRRLLKANPASSPAQAGLAHVLIQQKKYPEAEDLIRNALKATPDDPVLTAQLAAVLVAQDKSEALPLLEQLHAKHAGDASITRMLAQVEADAGNFAESDKLYVALLAATPKDADLLAGHGQNLIRLHQYTEAVQAFQSSTAIDETNGNAWSGLAFASMQTRQPNITIQALTARSKYLPESATIYFLWATAYDTLHDKKQAIVYYHRFLDSAAGKFPDQEWQAKQRLALLEKGR